MAAEALVFLGGAALLAWLASLRQPVVGPPAPPPGWRPPAYQAPPAPPPSWTPAPPAISLPPWFTPPPPPMESVCEWEMLSPSELTALALVDAVDRVVYTDPSASWAYLADGCPYPGTGEVVLWSTRPVIGGYERVEQFSYAGADVLWSWVDGRSVRLSDFVALPYISPPLGW